MNDITTIEDAVKFNNERDMSLKNIELMFTYKGESRHIVPHRIEGDALRGFDLIKQAPRRFKLSEITNLKTS